MNTRQQFLLLNVGIPLLFIGVAWCFIPIADAFQFSSDEGLELAKVDLYTRGFKLYDQIWNDQPPLPTVLWAGWLHLFGHSILIARLLTLSFGTLLLWAFVQSLWLTNGFVPALVGGIGLIISPYFVTMSTAVMMGIPSLSMTMLSSYCLLRSHKNYRWPWLIASGCCFTLSVQLKAFTLFLIPVLLGYLGLQTLRRNRHSQGSGVSSASPLQQVRVFSARLPWGQFGIWLGAFAIATLLMIRILPAESTDQTIAAHFNNTLRDAAGWNYGLGKLLQFFINDPDYWFLAFFGLWSLRRRASAPISTTAAPMPSIFLDPAVSFPMLWLLAAFLVLLWHRPLHFHYYLLLSIPLTWLAAVGIHEAIKRRQPKTKERWLNLRWATISGVAIFCLWFGAIGIPIKSMVLLGEGRYASWKSAQYFEALPQLLEYKEQTRWLFTDVLMYSFYADLPVPPEIAVFSSKRLTAGNLTIAEVEEIFKRYQPEQVLLGRFAEVKTALEPQLEQNYQRLVSNDAVTQYRLKTLQPKQQA
ncbi:MAG: glycosyltransferase family 39 protein [Thermosynechococcaceae cyanobacterium]